MRAGPFSARPLDFSQETGYNDSCLFGIIFSTHDPNDGKGGLSENMNYILMTDSDSDLPYALKVKYDIPVVYMPYALDGKEYFDDLGQTLDYDSYYEAMRNGAAPVTAALNEATYLDYFEPVLSSGKDLLFLAFSSQLSRTIESIRSAREVLLAKYPERRFTLVDTLSISAPQTLLVLKAHEMYRAGKPMDEVAQWVEDNKLRAQAFFTVDDLKYLKRGGRISSTAAALGTMLDLKPIIVESREGKLESVAKVRGRKKAIAYIVEQTLANLDDPTEAPCIVLHSACPEEAARLRDILKEKEPRLNIHIENIGPVIGAHTGPGALACCFLGKVRPQ